jgi:ABC-2 type transport system permease protein
VVIALLVALGALTGSVTLVVNEDIANLALIGVTNLQEGHRAAAVAGLLASVLPLFLIPMAIVMTFYALDSLYAERKDRSILFWRSLPVTDAETVLSKLLTAIILIPLATVAIIALTQLVVLVISSGWLMARNASPWLLIWKPVPLVQIWLASSYIAMASAIWAAPIVGWYLFVSGFAKRSPLMLAFLPLVVIPLLERLIFKSHYFYSAVANRMKDMPLLKADDLANFEALLENPGSLNQMTGSFSLLKHLDIAGFLINPGLYIGLIVCGLFVAAAIYVRRYRDDS